MSISDVSSDVCSSDLLVTSGFSGEYFGCQLEGSAAARFLDGVREEHVGIAARLTYPDGTVIEVERTTIGYRSTGSGPAHRSSSLSGLIRQVPEDAIEIESELLDHDELRAAMVEAQRLPRVLPEINGRRWPSWP